MKKHFVAGSSVTIMLASVGILVWYGLNDQARGIVVGVLLGIAGLLAGLTLALAIVGVMLLVNLRWSVHNAKPPPMLHSAQSAPGLAAPSGQQMYPPHFRPARHWHMVGEDDIEDAEFTH